MPRQDLIQVRRGTESEWISANPTLASGEAGFETDTGKLKIGNGTSAWLDLGYVSGDTNLTNNPVENEYADITALLADQGNQTTTFFQYVLDASADPNIASGDAYYEKLAGSTGTLATDYRLLSDTETITITDSNGYRVFRVQYIQDDSTPNTTANGGRIGFNYDTGTDKVTSIVFNSIYSDALDKFYAQRADNTYLIRFYNRNTGVYSFAEVTGWSVSGNYYTVTVANTIDIDEISVNNRIELFFDVDNGGNGTPTNGGTFTGALDLSNLAGTYYSTYNLGTSGTITFSNGGSETNFGYDYLYLVADGVTALCSDANADAIFYSQIGLPENRILEAGNYDITFLYTPQGTILNISEANQDRIVFGTAAYVDVLDDDNMSSDSATNVPSQQSVKAYVDSVGKVEYLMFAVSDETTALTIGDGKLTFRMPYAMTLTGVRASLTTLGSTSGTTTIDITEGGTSIFSTLLTIDHGEYTSATAATPAVISDSSLADNAEIKINIDAVTTGGTETGLKITLIGTRA